MSDLDTLREKARLSASSFSQQRIIYLEALEDAHASGELVERGSSHWDCSLNHGAECGEVCEAQAEAAKWKCAAEWLAGHNSEVLNPDWSNRPYNHYPNSPKTTDVRLTAALEATKEAE